MKVQAVGPEAFDREYEKIYGSENPVPVTKEWRLRSAPRWQDLGSLVENAQLARRRVIR